MCLRYQIDDIQARLESLLTLPVCLVSRAADMRMFHFGRLRRTEKETRGEIALHVQCPWRIDHLGTIVTGFMDLWDPASNMASDRSNWNYDDGNRQDECIQRLFGAGEQDTSRVTVVSQPDQWVVTAVESLTNGQARLELSIDYELLLFPAGSTSEHWRLFKIGAREPHFVVGGNDK